MESGLDQLRSGLSMLELFRHVEIAPTCSNLVAEWFETKFHYDVLVADLVADLQRAGIWPTTHCLAC